MRLYLPRKPTLSRADLGDGDYAELSSRFKACHVKIMIYWLATKTQQCADANQQVPYQSFGKTILILPSGVHQDWPQLAFFLGHCAASAWKLLLRAAEVYRFDGFQWFGA